MILCTPLLLYFSKFFSAFLVVRNFSSASNECFELESNHPRKLGWDQFQGVLGDSNGRMSFSPALDDILAKATPLP